MDIRKYVKACIASSLLVLAPWSAADTQFRLIVDASGSMLISDPDELTAESLQLISDLAPEEKASLGVWLFGERARVLLPEGPVNSQTKARLSDAIQSYEPGDLRTDLESVINLLLQTPDAVDLEPGFDRHWILVTDGMVDVSLDDAVNEASRNRISQELAKQLAERDIHLHTVSMTGYTDKDLLQSVSTLTNATHTEVATPDELLDTFDRIFSQAVPSEQLPFNGNSFYIDDAIEEATLLVFHQLGAKPSVYLPNGMKLNLSAENVSAVTTEHYTLITITKPAVGKWRVEDVDLVRSSIRVITNLSAQTTKVAPVLFVNEPIYSTVGLFQDNSLIRDPDILGVVSVEQKLNLLSGDTTKQIMQRDLPIANSQFKNKVDQLTAEGNYELISEVDGQTFARQLSQFFAVTKPIVLEADKLGDDQVIFSAKPTNLRLNLLRSNARLILTFADGTEESLEMPIIGEGFWQKIYPVAPNVSLSAHIRLIGITQTGVRFEYSTKPWILTREAAGNVVVSRDRPESRGEGSALAAAGIANRDVVPVVVTPQIDVIEAPEEVSVSEPQPEQNADPEAVEINEDEADAMAEEESKLDKTDWLLYGVINGLAIIALAGGYIVFRRIRKKRKQQVVEDSDV